MDSDFLKKKMDQTKDMVLNRILMVLLFFMALGLTISLSRVPETGFKTIYAVQIFLAIMMVSLFIFQNRLKTVTKGFLFLLALLGMALSSILSFGLYGFGWAYLIPATAIGFLYFEKRTGWMITLLCFLILIVSAILFSQNIISFVPSNPRFMEGPPMWMNMIITAVLISITITMFWNNLYSLLSNTFSHIHNQQKDMQKMNEDLIVARDRAEESDRLKSSFLQNISHEIRTPLNIIIGFSDMLSQSDDPIEQQELNKVIRDNSNSMLKIVNDIVDFSKIETNSLTLKNTAFNIKEILETLEKETQIDESKSIKLSIEKFDLVINNDRDRFHQIIKNVLDNAIRFTNQGEVTVACAVEENELVIKTVDTGIGIAADQQEKIFDRFYKIDSFSGGAGLGLSLSKSIANLLGGDITVESTPGEGSTFECRLPL